MISGLSMGKTAWPGVREAKDQDLCLGRGPLTETPDSVTLSQCHPQSVLLPKAMCIIPFSPSVSFPLFSPSASLSALQTH